jgi:hypothetical protein
VRSRPRAQAELGAQLHRLGPAGEERVGREVDVDVGERLAAQLAADVLVGVEHHRHVALLPQLVRRGQTGDAGADDRYSHALTRSASACSTAASSFSTRVRANAMPFASARAAASMSRSYATSR